MQRVCENCGTRRDEEDRFCRRCGLPLAQMETDSTAIIPLAPQELMSMHPSEAAKGAVALAVSLGLAAMRYEPTRQLILRGLGALVEGRSRKPERQPEPKMVQIIQIQQTVINQVVMQPRLEQKRAK